MEAAVAAPEEPRAKRRRKGASSDVAEASGGRGSKDAGASGSTPRERRRGRDRSRRPSKPASTARARKRRGKESESEAETEVEAPARGERVKVSRGNESDDDGGRRDDASDGGNGEARTGSANAKKGNRDRRRATGVDEIPEPCVAREVTALDLNRRKDEVVSGDAEEVEGDADKVVGRVDGSIIDENARDSGNREQASIVNVVSEMAPFEGDYDDEMLEEQLVGDVIRAYSNGGDLDADLVDWEEEDEMEFDDDEQQLVGDIIHAYSNCGDLDADGVDWEAEDEMEFDDDADDGDFMDDANEGGMTEPIQDHDKIEMQDLVNHDVVLSEGRCQDAEEAKVEEAGIKDEVEPKGEAAPGSSQQGLHVEILESDEEEVKVLENVSSAPSRKASVQAKLPTIPSCVAWRTRSSWGMIQDRLSYYTYFEALSDEPKEEDDTEVELDEEDNNDDDSSETSDEDEEKDEEEAERRKLKNRIYTSDDDMIDSTVPTSRYEDTTVPTSRYDDTTVHTSRYDIKWEEDEDASVDISQPISFKKATRWNPVAVGNDTFTEQQKQSRFTWELERRKKVKLGMKTHPLYGRDLDSDSSSSGPDQIKRYEFKDGDHKVGRKKKHPLSKSGKKSGHATMLKRQSLLKLLIDKMSGDKNEETLPFDQNPQLQFTFKEMHPLVFSFGDEDLVPADKPEQDGAMDMLWADFDFALESENIGTYYDDEVYFHFCKCMVLFFIYLVLI